MACWQIIEQWTHTGRPQAHIFHIGVHKEIEAGTRFLTKEKSVKLPEAVKVFMFHGLRMPALGARTWHRRFEVLHGDWDITDLADSHIDIMLYLRYRMLRHSPFCCTQVRPRPKQSWHSSLDSPLKLLSLQLVL